MDTYFEVFIIYNRNTNLKIDVLHSSNFYSFFSILYHDFSKYYIVRLLIRDRDHVVVRKNCFYSKNDYSNFVASRDYLEKGIVLN